MGVKYYSVRDYSLSQELAFLAVADARRRAILALLKRGEQSAGAIARCFDVSWPAISRHLRVLKEAGLVRERRHGRHRRYALDRSKIRDIFGSWVASFDTRWEENLEALRAHVEARRPHKER
jgi:DNA-binding transcriptional ArsR family regulator